ncbi:MAG: UDP-N-acetylmuramoyl-L-alanine--D-glutamate ligase [Rickettsiales bacterium]|jgi:UDP-N-acetylmuramoylalanine--D-glutamate ligase|nr:UDP-N-acetylmuramoyl-L-alanine--D-glutamate ligase [Rickettsiales bacterium]
MKIDELLSKKILVWGYGLEGRSSVDFLLKRGARESITVADSAKIGEKLNGVKFIPEGDVLSSDFDIVIKSPGVSLYREEVETLRNRGVVVSSALNILLAETERLKKPKVIAITGTKGKSTTATLCHFMLKNLGYRAALLGNIGISFLDCLDNLNSYDYLVLELSSCQTANMLYDVNYSAVLNLFPEHIDWHRTHDNYFRDKMNINFFSHNRIINFEDEITKKYRGEDKDYIYFNNGDGFHLDGDHICRGDKKLFDMREINSIIGRHFFSNLNSIFTVFDMEKIDVEKAFKSLNGFKMLEHRVEKFFEDGKRNIIFINDSISTIPEATTECLKTFDNYKNIRLALGGFDRKQNYDALAELINKNEKIRVFLIGTTGEKLKKKIKNSAFFENFDDLVSAMTNGLENDTAVLLSPASASFDMFKNFEERGRIFKETVRRKMSDNAVTV